MANLNLWLASQAGRCQELEALLPGNFDQETLRAALHVASANDHAGVVSILLRAGAVCGDVNGVVYATLWQRTFVETCTTTYALLGPGAAEHGAIKCLQVLVLAKADVDARNGLGFTPVFLAATYGHLNVVRLLIRAKVDAARCTHYTNRSPLFAAAAGGHAAVVRCLLVHVPALAAVATRQSSYMHAQHVPAGSTPLDAARQFRHDDVVSLLAAAANY